MSMSGIYVGQWVGVPLVADLGVFREKILQVYKVPFLGTLNYCN